MWLKNYLIHDALKILIDHLYCANSKAWMRSDIFVNWFNYLNNYFHTLNRKILLLINSAGSHFNPKIFEETNPNNFNSNRKNNENEIVVNSVNFSKKNYCVESEQLQN